ncbi:MAG: endonuclease MutS2 [Peptococcaceae bacterium]|nr:endonuclease MutS2 [Peptococcaceae bacterium]
MDRNTLRRLEFHKILEQLSAFAGSGLGKERALALEPAADPLLIQRMQAETTEGRELFRLEPAAELGGWRDIRVPLVKLERGAVLEPEELLAVGQTMAACRQIKKFFAGRTETYPLLGEITSVLFGLPALEQRIIDSILPGGEVADRASDTLARIRRQIGRAQSEIKDHLESLIRSPHYQKYLQDPLVTIREGRYVVPVKVEHRAQVPGIVHDQSASGATLFIEPMPVVEKNNELRRLIAAEKQEVALVLAGLSAAVAEHAGALRSTMEALGELDFILARARYSLQLDAVAPVLEGGARLDLKKARHPLLQGEVVPVSLTLGHDFDTLVITGPNTGGKTVTLKTAGLIVLMAQAGLHIPAAEGSGLGIFRQVFADIGDEQSIEQSLSTFSSHLTNIVDILRRAGKDSLVLLDELGAGTDPAEGAALARAILEKLHAAGAKTVATTHYSELKSFAFAAARVENASVEFDAVTLRPTYRLLVGRPGRSNAFEIARRLGLPEGIVERARSFLTEDQVRVEDLLLALEKARQEAEAEREAAAALRAEADQLRRTYEERERELAGRTEAILAKAQEEAEKLVRAARTEAEAAIRELREKLSADAARTRETAIQEARLRLKQMQERAARAVKRKKPAGEVPDVLRPGEEVFLPRYNQKGYVIQVPDGGGEVQVQVGVLKLNVPAAELRKVDEPKKASGDSHVGAVLMEKAKQISTELDLRGLYAEEAVQEVEKYLDDAYLAGLPRVYLIHGKGTGSLRAAIHRQLAGHNRVKSYRLGEHGEGGYGVTVVELK